MKFIADQTAYMDACGQSIDRPNKEQTELFLRRTIEELGETLVAANPSSAGEIRALIANLAPFAVLSSQTDRTELFCGLLEMIMTTAGAGISAGLPMSAGWQEVMRSKHAKIDPDIGMVRRRGDGIIVNPDNWTPPNLAALLDRNALSV